LVLCFVMALGLWPATAAATTAQPGMAPTESADRATPIGAAVTALTGPRPTDAVAHLPADFEAKMGYRPQVVAGMPIDPEGACSSPIPLPDRFEPLCKTHDFGYDLLRLADKDGRPLAGWARISLDTMLAERMHQVCDDPTCDWAADLARLGLSFNTWRQQSGAPVARESFPAIVVSTFVRSGESLASLVGLA
jgi:hypothetical protein